MTQKEYRHTVQAHRNGVSKAELYLEFNLGRDAKGNKKGFLQVYQQQKEN